MRDTNQDLDFSLRHLSSTTHPRREFVAGLRADLQQRTGGTSSRRPRRLRIEAIPWLDLAWLRSTFAQAGLVVVLVGLVALAAWLLPSLAPLAGQSTGRTGPSMLTPLAGKPQPSSIPGTTLAQPSHVLPTGALTPSATAPAAVTAAATTVVTVTTAATATPAPEAVITLSSVPEPLLCSNSPGPLRSEVTLPPQPTFSSLSAKDQSRSRRILARYNQLCTDVKNLQVQYIQANHDHLAFQSFLFSQQLLKRNTDNLQSSLNIYDSFIKQGNAALQTAIDTLNDRSGFDSSGNVVLLDMVDGNVNSALDNFLAARNFLANGVNELHGGLNQFHQVWGVGVPNIPEMHPAPYVLPAS